MGIRISDRVVQYDAASNNLINNRPSDNPIIQTSGDIDVYSIFRRIRARRNGADGNPLVYALKGIYDHSIDLDNILAFLPDYYSIVRKVAPHVKSQYVVPIPSSSSISLMCAKRMARNMEATLLPAMFVKKTQGDVCKEIDKLIYARAIEKEHLREIKRIRSSLGKSLSSNFSMKVIDHDFRQYFSPVKFRPTQDRPLVEGASVLVIDDLLSTGTSLRSARDLLMGRGTKNIKFLCLFSSLDDYSQVN